MIAGFLQKCAEKIGFNRDFYKEENIPTDPANIALIPFFGDIRSLFILSSLLLHRYKEQDKPSKYLILCGWPGFASFFPYVDEYWSIQSDVHVRRMYATTDGFGNNNDLVNQYCRNLNQFFFEDLVDPLAEFSQYYNNGLTDKFFQKYKHVKRFLPSVPSSASLGKDFNREYMEKGGYKVFIYPSMYLNNWHNNKTRLLQFPREFWLSLIDRLIAEKFTPVVCKSFCTHDLSLDFNKNCIYFSSLDFGHILSVMRMSHCVIDMFTDVSRFALAARCPFLTVDERNKYAGLKEYELDDLCGQIIPKKYIFSFSTIINGGNIRSWDFDVLNSVIMRLKDFLPSVDKDMLPPTGQSLEIVSYDVVRKKKLKKLGVRLLKVPKDNIYGEFS